MGNSCVITTKENYEKNGVGVYLHWYGSLENVEGFLAYCKLKGFRSPEKDNYGWSYLCTVLGNFFGDGLSVGIDNVKTLVGVDNGVYFIKDWEIVDRTISEPIKSDGSQMYDMLVAINEEQGIKIKVPYPILVKYCEDNGYPV